MNEFAQRIMQEYPVRRKAKEKEAFRLYLMGTLRKMGYEPFLQHDTSALSLSGITGSTNVVVGDPDTAKVIFTAHYDTGVHELFPPMISPTRPVSYLLYQALTPVSLLLCSFLLSLAITKPLDLPLVMLPLFIIFLLAGLFYVWKGPSEKRTVNDNTSGVVALLETAKAVSPRYRADVCFLFLDDGVSGMRGAKGFRRKYPSCKEKSVINLDSVGDGDEILILPSKYSRWNDSLLGAITENFSNSEKKTCYLKTDGLTYYPSDNRAFKYSVAICADTKVQGFDRCIRPRKATQIDKENIEILRDGLSKLVAAYHG